MCDNVSRFALVVSITNASLKIASLPSKDSSWRKHEQGVVEHHPILSCVKKISSKKLTKRGDAIAISKSETINHSLTDRGWGRC